jgi:hypothetical protein
MINIQHGQEKTSDWMQAAGYPANFIYNLTIKQDQGCLEH